MRPWNDGRRKLFESMERQRGQSAELPQIITSCLTCLVLEADHSFWRSESAQHVAMRPAATGTDVIFALGRKWGESFLRQNSGR